MYTKKLIDDVIKLLLNSSNYHDEVLKLSKDDQIKYAQLLLDRVIIRSPMYSDAVFKHLINIDSGDPRAMTNLSKIIEAYLHIKPKIIVEMDKEIIRPNEEAKTTFMDNLYLIDENIYLDIEAQSELSSSKQLINKNLLYQASVYTNFSVKGETNAANYHGVTVLCFYEDKYIGDWLKDVSDKKDDHVKIYEPMGYHYGPDGNIDLSIIIVELGKINQIVREKGINHLSEKEALSYVIKNAHFMEIDPEVKENIEILKRKEKVIKDMVDMRDEYLRNAYEQVLIMKDYIERSTIRLDEIEKQRQDYYQRVLKRFKTNYCEDSEFLKDLSLENYKYIDDLIFEDASYDEIKEYVNLIS